jgi:hypothetical protein
MRSRLTLAGRTAETQVAVIKDWTEPGTTVISDCWAGYKSLDDEGFTHVTVNHSITFVDETTGAHTNTTESTWRQVKATLHPLNRRTDLVLIFILLVTVLPPVVFTMSLMLSTTLLLFSFCILPCKVYHLIPLMNCYFFSIHGSPPQSMISTAVTL